MEIQANPDLNHLKVIIWIIGPLMLTMLAVIGYFLKQQFDATREMSNELASIRLLITKVMTHDEITDPVLEKRLNNHSQTIGDHEKRLTKVETHCEITHSKKKDKYENDF
jgi:hypothetical protein